MAMRCSVRPATSYSTTRRAEVEVRTLRSGPVGYRLAPHVKRDLPSRQRRDATRHLQPGPLVGVSDVVPRWQWRRCWGRRALICRVAPQAGPAQAHIDERQVRLGTFILPSAAAIPGVRDRNPTGESQLDEKVGDQWIPDARSRRAAVIFGEARAKVEAVATYAGAVECEL